MSDTPNQNTGDEQIPDETLMELADGTLAPAERAAVSEALARNPALMDRFEAFLFTRGPLTRAFDEVLTAPIPERLLATVRGTAPAPVRRAPSARGSGLLAGLAETFRMAAFSPAGAAAALLIGTTAGWLLHETTSDDLVRLDERGLIASASLQRALDATPMSVSAGVTRDLTLKPTFTFRNSDNTWCRQYDLVSRRGLQSGGIACREGDTWRVLTQMGARPATTSSGKTMPAAPAPPGLLDDIRGQIKEGDVLDRGQEDLLIRKRWQTEP